ncbi:acyltransferase family protein [Blautia sp. CLA-JM-H16]|mgnify:FL=1|uniref:Acyltransferase family protein n=1 Tax=Blautia aquisgranensis TaxID=3133153 RepID=A0ABV1BGS8_9FIRM
MKQKTDSQGVPYSYLVDNIKVLLIFLVVFNHIIAFQLVKVDVIVRYVWYAITIFHMPAFVFMSGYLSKKPQDVLKNVKNLLIPYILGYSLTWYAYVWLGRSMDYELLRPSGTVMWYVLALFIYRLTIEALGKVRFIVPLSIIFALWAGTRPEFTTYLSSSRIVVFFPFFVAGYLWKSDYTKVVRKFKGKWVLIPISGLLLYAIPNFMMENNIPIDIFRGNHTYQLCGMDNITGMLIRLLMYLVSFVLVLTFLALIPDIKLPITFIGRNTMGIYFFHYPIMIVLNGLLLLSIPKMLNVWVLFGVSWIFVLVLGSAPVSFIYNGMLNLLIFIFFKREKQVQDEGLEDEYDEDEHYEIIRKRKKAIEELAATLEEEENARKVEDNVAVVLEKEDPLEKLNKEEFFVDEDFDMEADSEDAESPQAFEKLQELDELLELETPQEEEETQTEKE